MEDKKFNGCEELKGIPRARNREKRAERRKRKRKKLTNIEKKSEEKVEVRQRAKRSGGGVVWRRHARRKVERGLLLFKVISFGARETIGGG